MLAGLGAVVTQLVNVVKAHHIVVLFGGVLFLCSLLDLGVKVVAVLVLDLQEPCHVVDTGDLFLSALQLILHAKVAQNALGANLHAVAKTNRLDVGVTLHVACQHCHGVGVV